MRTSHYELCLCDWCLDEIGVKANTQSAGFRLFGNCRQTFVQFWSRLDLIPERDRNFVLSTENLTSRWALLAQNHQQGAEQLNSQIVLLLAECALNLLMGALCLLGFEFPFSVC